MRKIFAMVCVMTLILSLVGCQNNDHAKDAEKYSIKMNDEDWLYEKIPSTAKAGDTVTVKIRFATDLGYLFLVNGEQIEMTDYTDEYWQFSFTMPEDDVEIDFKTYDGFLPDVHYGTLIETFWLQNLDAEYVSIREYYDEYDHGAIVAMIDSCDYTANIWCEEVAGMDFMYGDGNRLLVLKDGTFYTLTEAYDKGVLSKESIGNLFWKFFFQHPGLYADTETTVKVTRPDLTIHTGPGYDNEDIGTLLTVGTYTITEQVVCDEGITWGKLKSGLGWIDLNKASDTTQHIPITMERIDKELLDELDCHLYLREETDYTQYLLIKPYEALTDVKLCFMNFADNGFEPGETLYSLDKLDEDKPLVLGVVFYGDFTTFGFTFTDGEGIERQYMIYTSGRNGSIVLQEKE
ncbi:MAG: hypothetical protein IJ325_07795 [Clostridia bacterium]|nr:hypothetical protein [Clostridia bacterium]